MNGETRETWLARVATASAALAVSIAGLYPGANPDTFGHLAQGRQIAELGRVPAVDSWSLLPGPPRTWHNYEWLSDLGTYWLYAGFGYEAVTLFKCALLALTVWCLARFAGALAGPRAAVLTSMAVISAIPTIRIRLSDRPHVLGICLAAAYLLLLTLLAQKSHAPRVRNTLIAGLAVLHLVWVNAHGSHLLGLAITVSFMALGGRALLPAFGTVLGLELAASCISPYGPAIVIDAVDHIADARYRGLVTEWLPWRESDPPWLQLGPALHGAALALLLPRILRLPRSAHAALAVGALLGIASFRSIRFVAEFMLLSAPLAGAGLSVLLAQLAQRRFLWLSNGIALVLAPAVLLGAAALPPEGGIGIGISYAQLPVASATVLARHGGAPRVLAAMQDSWFTMFAAPRARFVIDGRVPFYGPEHVRRVSEAFASEPQFARLVATSDVNTVIVNHTAIEERKLVEFAPNTGFALVLLEDLHALYVRGDALTRAGTARFPPLRVLQPNYRLDWLLALPDTQLTALRSEFVRLAELPGTDAYRGWVEGVLAMAPLKRGGPDDGFRWPRTAAEWDIYRTALPKIRRAAKTVPFVPIVSALHAALSTVLCEFDQAERALAHALEHESSREPLLVAQELALRRGELDQVRRVIEQARARPEARDDPWLEELAAGVESPPACP